MTFLIRGSFKIIIFYKFTILFVFHKFNINRKLKNFLEHLLKFLDFKLYLFFLCNGNIITNTELFIFLNVFFFQIYKKSNFLKEMLLMWYRFQFSICMKRSNLIHYLRDFRWVEDRMGQKLRIRICYTK